MDVHQQQLVIQPLHLTQQPACGRARAGMRGEGCMLGSAEAMPRVVRCAQMRGARACARAHNMVKGDGSPLPWCMHAPSPPCSRHGGLTTHDSRPYQPQRGLEVLGLQVQAGQAQLDALPQEGALLHLGPLHLLLAHVHLGR